jgi:hypothetical protein
MGTAFMALAFLDRWYKECREVCEDWKFRKTAEFDIHI